jgi:rRNA maturation RNase YbeY
MAIHFFEEDVISNLKKKKDTKTWIKETIITEGKTLGTLNYVFCSDEYLHKMNVDFLQHDTLTDIITFDQSEVANKIEGDIFISVDRVKENAKKFNSEYIDELNRVMIHGALHLIGYKDKKKADQILMRSKEDYYLKTRTF